MIRCFVRVITCFVICMIFCGLIHRVHTYDEFEGVFAVGMVEMDKRIYLGRIQERQDQQDGTQFCSLEVILHGYSDCKGLKLSPTMPWFKSFLSRELSFVYAMLFSYPTPIHQKPRRSFDSWAFPLLPNHHSERWLGLVWSGSQIVTPLQPSSPLPTDEVRPCKVHSEKQPPNTFCHNPAPSKTDAKALPTFFA